MLEVEAISRSLTLTALTMFCNVVGNLSFDFSAENTQHILYRGESASALKGVGTDLPEVPTTVDFTPLPNSAAIQTLLFAILFTIFVGVAQKPWMDFYGKLLKICIFALDLPFAH